MHIVHYVSSIRAESGGIYRAVIGLARLMQNRGHTVTLVTAESPHDPPDERRDRGFTGVCRVGTLLPGIEMLGVTARRRAARAVEQADVLHLHAIWDPAVRQVAHLATHAGRPYIFTTHGMLDDWSIHNHSQMKKRCYLAWFARPLLDAAAMVHFTASAERAQASRYCHPARQTVIPYPLEGDFLRDLPGLALAEKAFKAFRDRTPIVLFLGRVHPKKGVDILIDAAAKLDPDMRWKVVIAGPGDTDYINGLRQQAHQQGLANRIEFVGMVHGELLRSLIQASAMFVLPTQQENFGIAIFEAMACATPVVISDRVDVRDELVDAGAVIVRRDSLAFAEAIGRLLADPARARQIGNRGRAWAVHHLDPARLGRVFEQMYETVAGLPDRQQGWLAVSRAVTAGWSSARPVGGGTAGPWPTPFRRR